MIQYLALIIASVVIMEVVAILSHKYIMHGPGWILHKSHHSKSKDSLELNDYYFIFFSLPSIFCIIFGLLSDGAILFSIGIGILLYGLIYIFLHDIMVHKRFGLSIKANNKYLRKIKKSHLKHHSTTAKDGASNFGFITYL